MSKSGRRKAQYSGNKVKVPVERKGAKRRDRQRADASAPDITPVDYQPPGSEEDRLRSIREAGYREGARLAAEERSGAGTKSGGQTQTSSGARAGSAESAESAAPKAEQSAPAAQDAAKAPEKTAPPAGDRAGQDKTFGDIGFGFVSGEPGDAGSPADSRAGGTAETKKQRGKKNKTEKNGNETGAAKADKTAKNGKENGAAKANKTGSRPTVPRTVIMTLSALFMLYALSPLAVGVVTVGILPPLCIGAFFFAIAYFWPRICACRKPWFNALFVACGIAVIAGISLIFYLFGQMYAASAVKPQPNRSDYTVIVLGCKTIGNRPSLMLEDRLDAAAEFLTAHPGAYCIVSGGQGDDELAPEAVIMKKYLVSKGISELRIVEEKNSSTTEENIANSCAMLDDCNLYEDIVVVTDRFHQYRARHYVTQRGLRCYAVNSETRWYLAVHYWFKEMVAVAMLMLGMNIS